LPLNPHSSGKNIAVTLGFLLIGDIKAISEKFLGDHVILISSAPASSVISHVGPSKSKILVGALHPIGQQPFQAFDVSLKFKFPEIGDNRQIIFKRIGDFW